MNQRLLSVFGFALVVAAAASFLVYRLIASHVSVAAPVSTTSAVVANKDLEIGTLIHEGDLRTVAWSSPLPADALAKVEDASGRGVVSRIGHDELVVSSRLAAQGAGAGLAATIPIGMRAVALRVNDVVGLAGFVLPGMRVDVLVVGNAPGFGANSIGSVSRTVLQNLEVLSANQRIERNAAGKPEDAQVVNLLVTPDQAEVLNLASGDSNKVQLVLRNPLDTHEQVTHGSNSLALFGLTATAPMQTVRTPAIPRAPRPNVNLIAKAAPPQRAPETVEIFSGAKRSEQRFDGKLEER